MRGKALGVYQRGRVWWISFYDLSGRRHYESVGPGYKEAVKARTQRLAEVQAGKFRPRKEVPALRDFVAQWRADVVHLKPSTLEGYGKLLRNLLLPAFGDYPLTAINRAEVKRFIAEKTRQQRHSYSERNPNPNRLTLSRKYIRNAVALLSGLLESATADYGLLDANPLRGILRSKHFPADAHRLEDRRVRFLEPEEFRRATDRLLTHQPRVLEMVLVAALAGLRWGELVGLRVAEDVDFRTNRIRVTRSLYNRVPQTPKTRASVGDVVMCPTVRRILLEKREGWAFSKDAETPIGNGTWVKRQWRKAQAAAGIRGPISWHDLRHQFVCLLIAAGKHPKYIAQQARHQIPPPRPGTIEGGFRAAVCVSVARQETGGLCRCCQISRRDSWRPSGPGPTWEVHCQTQKCPPVLAQTHREETHRWRVIRGGFRA